MNKIDIKVGSDYALRERRIRKAPFQRVRILQHVRGTKWKAQWISPNPGLIDYIDSAWLIVPWKEQKSFLREEAAAERLAEYALRKGYKRDSPVDNALSEVFGDVGDDAVSYYRGELTGPEVAIQRIRERAGLRTSVESPYSYVDRSGDLHVPFDEALELAKRFAAAEPSTVLAGVEATERKWESEARQPGKDYLVSLLNEYRAAWALVRQWAGLDRAVATREDQIKKLERLVWDAIYALQKAGLDSEAGRLRRVLERG